MTSQPSSPRIEPLMWLALGVTIVGELFDALDGLITTVAGPSIQRELGGGGAFIQWLAAGYTIAMAAGLLVGGRLGDIFGRRRIFLIGMAGFTAMSMLAAVASSSGTLIGARILQGLLGALMVPQTFGMYRDIFPPERLGLAFSAVGPIMAIAGIAGPLASGVILDADLLGLGWRALFLVNLPFCLLALVLGARVLPADRPDSSLTLDWGSAALAAVALPMIVFALVEGRDLGWPLWVFALAAVAVALLVVFGRRQYARVAAGRTPLLEPTLLRNRTFVGGLLYGVAAFGAGMCVGLLVALYAQLGLGMTPLAASLLTLPDMLGMMLGMALMGPLGSTRRTMAIGALGMGVGSIAVLGAVLAGGGDVHVWTLVPGLLVIGIGSGLTMGPYFDMIITSVSERETGSASGALSAAQQMSAAFGVAVFGSVFFGVAANLPGELGYSRGLAWALGAIAVIILSSIALLRMLPERAADSDPAAHPDLETQLAELEQFGQLESTTVALGAHAG